MKTKPSSFSLSPLVIAAALLVFFSICGLWVLSALTGREGPYHLVLAFPADLGSPRIDVSQIEQFCEDEFLVSYEIPGAAMASASLTEYPVTLVRTNSAYPHLMGLSLLEGAFFSKQAWDGKQRQAVLNERAAFILFGSSRVGGNRFHIRGEPWIVTGVIRDGDDENCRIYIPSSINGGDAHSLMALTDDGGGITASYIKNSLKNLGIREGSFTFYDLEKTARLFWERPLGVLGIFSVLFLLCLLPLLGKNLRAAAGTLRGELKKRYPRELFTVHRPLLLQCIALVLSLAASAGAALFLALKVISLCLPWRDLPALADLKESPFESKLGSLYTFDTPSRLLFYAALCFMGLFFVSLLVDLGNR